MSSPASIENRSAREGSAANSSVRLAAAIFFRCAASAVHAGDRVSLLTVGADKGGSVRGRAAACLPTKASTRGRCYRIPPRGLVPRELSAGPMPPAQCSWYKPARGDPITSAPSDDLRVIVEYG